MNKTGVDEQIISYLILYVVLRILIIIVSCEIQDFKILYIDNRIYIYNILYRPLKRILNLIKNLYSL